MKKTAQFCTNEFIQGNIQKNDDMYEISFILLKEIDCDTVYRAYFLESYSNNLISIGVIETSGRTGFLKIKCDYGKDTVVIMKKDTKNCETTYITAAFFGETWNVQGFLNGEKTELYQTLNRIKNELTGYRKCDDGFYKITDFVPIGNLSAVKCVIFEKYVNYSFNKFGFYLFRLENNEITIGVNGLEGINPLEHIKDFCTENNGIYYTKIILEEDGQYFESKT